MKGPRAPAKNKAAPTTRQARSLADRLAAQLPDLGPGQLAVWVEDPPLEPEPRPSSAKSAG